MNSLAASYLEDLSATARYAKSIDNPSKVVPKHITEMLQEYSDAIDTPDELLGCTTSPKRDTVWEDFKDIMKFSQQQAERDLYELVRVMSLDSELAAIPIRFVHTGQLNAFAIFIPEDESAAIALSSSFIHLVGDSVKLGLLTLLTDGRNEVRRLHRVERIVRGLYSDAMFSIERIMTEDFECMIQRQIITGNEIPDSLREDALLISLMIQRFVIAHELAHHALNHQKLYATHLSNLGADDSVKLAAYSRDLEFEADAWAYHALLRTCEPDSSAFVVAQAVPGIFFSILHLISQMPIGGSPFNETIASSHPSPFNRAVAVMTLAGYRKVTSNPVIEAIHMLTDFFRLIAESDQLPNWCKYA